MTEVKKLKNSKEVIAYLAEKFPLCFFLEGEAKPLKIGLFKDLTEVLAEDEFISNTQLRQALRLYTSSFRYLYGCREGSERVDLYGNAAGLLEKEHVEHAAKKLAEAKAKFSEKKQLEKKTKQKNITNKAIKKVPFTKKNNTRIKKDFNLVPIDIEKLEKESEIKVKVGNKTQKAKVLEVMKDNVRIELDNGMVITVMADRLFR